MDVAKKVSDGISTLTPAQMVSAKETYKELLTAYANKNFIISFRKGENIFSHFSLQFAYKFMTKCGLPISNENFALSNNALNYANIEMGFSRFTDTVKKLVKADKIKSTEQLKAMKKSFGVYLTVTTNEEMKEAVTNSTVKETI